MYRRKRIILVERLLNVPVAVAQLNPKIENFIWHTHSELSSVFLCVSFSAAATQSTTTEYIVMFEGLPLCRAPNIHMYSCIHVSKKEIRSKEWARNANIVGNRLKWTARTCTTDIHIMKTYREHKHTHTHMRVLYAAASAGWMAGKYTTMYIVHIHTYLSIRISVYQLESRQQHAANRNREWERTEWYTQRAIVCAVRSGLSAYTQLETKKHIQWTDRFRISFALLLSLSLILCVGIMDKIPHYVFILQMLL